MPLLPLPQDTPSEELAASEASDGFWDPGRDTFSFSSWLQHSFGKLKTRFSSVGVPARVPWSQGIGERSPLPCLSLEPSACGMSLASGLLGQQSKMEQYSPPSLSPEGEHLWSLSTSEGGESLRSCGGQQGPGPLLQPDAIPAKAASFWRKLS